MAVARQFDVEIPFTRPTELATDTATSFGVIRHALDYLENEEGALFDAVMLLEPSSPFATSTDLDNAVEMMITRDARLVVGVVEQKLHPMYIGEMDLDGRIGEIIDRLKTLSTTNRQAKPQQYTMNGALYLFRVDGFRDHGTIYYDTERSYGYLMDPYHSIEIDQEIDLLWAEFLVLRGYVDLTPWK
jgi:CMP-N-acetylneuraminic acid synthetase